MISTNNWSADDTQTCNSIRNTGLKERGASYWSGGHAEQVGDGDGQQQNVEPGT